MLNEKVLEGKRALITGASRGIGAAIARTFAQAGAALVLAARTESDLQQVASTCCAQGVQVEAVPTDIGDAAALEHLAERAGRVDVLVNNAGIGYFVPFQELSLAQWDEMFAVNVRAMFYLTRLVVPHMIESGGGDVINIASSYSHRGYPRGSGYNATKFAVRGFSEALQHELGAYGIRVMVISPHTVKISESDKESTGRPKYLQPEDVAATVLHTVTLPGHASTYEVLMVGTAQGWSV